MTDRRRGTIRGGGTIQPRKNAQQAKAEEDKNTRKPLVSRYADVFRQPTGEGFGNAGLVGTEGNPQTLPESAARMGDIVGGVVDAATQSADAPYQGGFSASSYKPQEGGPLLSDDLRYFLGMGPNGEMLGPEQPTPEQLEAFDRQKAYEAQQATSRIGMVERNFQYLDALRGENLSVTGQRILDEAMAETERQLTDIDRQIVDIQGQMSIAETLRNPFKLGDAGQLQTAGVAPKGSATADVMARLVADGGITPDMAKEAGLTGADLQRMADRGEELVNAAVAGENVESDLDALSAEAAAAVAAGNLANEAPSEFQFKMRSRIRDLVDTRRTVIEQDEAIQKAIQSEDLAQATQKFTFNFDPTPQGAYYNAFDDRMAPILQGTGLGAAGQAQLVGELQTLEQSLPAGKLDFSNPELGVVQQNLMTMAEKYDIDPTILLQEFEAARAEAVDAEEEMNTVWESAKLTPGSLQAGTAIYQVAENLYANQGDEGKARANALANSPSLHMLIQLGSNGQVGSQRGGTKFGLGGLPRDIYEQMGYNPDEVIGDPKAELEALINFVDTEFAGDPVAALSHLSTEKSWGTGK